MSKLKSTTCNGVLSVGDISNLHQKLLNLEERISNLEIKRNKLRGIEGIHIKTGTLVVHGKPAETSHPVFNPATTKLKEIFELTTTPRVRDYHVTFMNGDGNANAVHFEAAQSFQEDTTHAFKNRIYALAASNMVGSLRFDWAAIYNENLIEGL